MGEKQIGTVIGSLKNNKLILNNNDYKIGDILLISFYILRIFIINSFI